MTIKIEKPQPEDYPGYFSGYVNFFEEGTDIISILEQNQLFLSELLENLPDDKLDYSYQEGKWSIKELILHIMDCERIFLTRALRIARNDKTELPGFDQDVIAPYSGASQRSKESLVREYNAIRNNTLEFFRNAPDESFSRSGIVNGHKHTVASIAFQIAGHEQHHIKILKERYL